MIMLQSALQHCNQLNVCTDTIFHGAVMCVRVFRSRWWVWLRKWRGYFDAWRWKPTQENTAGTHILFSPLSISTISPSIFYYTYKRTHRHTLGCTQTKQSINSLSHTVWPWMWEWCWSYIHQRLHIPHTATHVHKTTQLKMHWNYMLYPLMHSGPICIKKLLAITSPKLTYSVFSFANVLFHLSHFQCLSKYFRINKQTNSHCDFHCISCKTVLD